MLVVAHLINLTPIPILHNQTPFEVLSTGTSPSYDVLKVLVRYFSLITTKPMTKYLQAEVTNVFFWVTPLVRKVGLSLILILRIFGL